MEHIEYIDISILNTGGLRGESPPDDPNDDLLGESLLKEQQAPITAGPLISERRDVYDGNRRVRAARRKGIKKLLARLLDHAPTPEELAVYQLISDLHKKHLSAYERSMGILAVERANPGLNVKQIAALIPMEESVCWKYLQARKLCPEAMEAYRAGSLGLTSMVEVSRVPLSEQPAMLGVEGGRDGLQKARQRLAARAKEDQGEPKQPPERTERVRIPLLVEIKEANTNGAATLINGTVTLASKPGGTIDLYDAESLLREALKAVKDAQGRGIGLRAAQASWKDMATPKDKAAPKDEAKAKA